MARAYQTSLENDKLSRLSADELINMLVEAEWDDRLTAILKEGCVMQSSVISQI